MINKTVRITQDIEVGIDETKFTPEFYKQFSEVMFDSCKTLDDHIKYIAELEARGVLQLSNFVEGYGYKKDFSISTHSEIIESEIL